jgi:UDP-glucose 4-epimerase
MKTISLRIGNPYGPYQLSGTRVGVIARYLKAAYLGSTIEVWGDGTAVRDYIYIDDLVSAVVAASEARTIKSGEYNIGSGQGHSINDIIYLVGSVTKKDLEVKYTSARSFDVPRMVLNCELFSAATGWSVDVPLAEGIQHLWRVITETVK